MAEEVPADTPVVLFDGVCNLCTGLVQFIIPRDPGQRFRFAPLQSPVGTQLLEQCGLPTDQLETFVLVEGGECYTKSSAALRIARHLGGPYAWLYPLRWIPRPLRDAVYEFVADHRYGWFGRREECMMPTAETDAWFLDTADEPP